MKLDQIVQEVKNQSTPYLHLGTKYLQLVKEQFLKKPGKTVEGPVSRVCCDYGQSKIVFVEMLQAFDGLVITRFHKLSQPREADKKVEVLKQGFESGGFSTNKIRISVKGQGVIVRFVQFPKMKPEDLKSAIAFEAEKFIPFKSNEVVVDFHILEEEAANAPGMMNLLLVAVKRDEIYPIIKTFQDAGLNVELIDIDALAFLNALEFFYPDDFKTTVGVLDIGTEISNLSIVKKCKPRFIRDISYGGVDIIKRLKRKLGFTDQQAIETLEVDREPTPDAVEVLKEALGNLVADLKVSINYFFDQVQSSEPLTKLFLAGGGGYHPIVVETLTKDLGFPVATMDIVSKIQLAPNLDAEMIKKNQGLLPVAVGLGLRDS